MEGFEDVGRAVTIATHAAWEIDASGGFLALAFLRHFAIPCLDTLLLHRDRSLYLQGKREELSLLTEHKRLTMRSCDKDKVSNLTTTGSAFAAKRQAAPSLVAPSSTSSSSFFSAFPSSFKPPLCSGKTVDL